jgi:hypothetical protein
VIFEGCGVVWCGAVWHGRVWLVKGMRMEYKIIAGFIIPWRSMYILYIL